MKTLDDIPVDGKRVLVRTDFNVAFNSAGRVGNEEDYRLKAALPTLEELQQRRCKIIILTHRGRPGESSDNGDLTPVAHRLAELLRDDVKQTRHLYGDDVEAIVSGLSPGAFVLLPNVRLDEREEHRNERFAQQLAQVADVYVNEAFSASHRDHTSVALLPRLMTSCAGRRTVVEVEALDRLRDAPVRPYVAIASGAKIETKIGLLESLTKTVDVLCVAGRLANVFLAAQQRGSAAGFSASELNTARQLLATARAKLVLPVDVVVGSVDGKSGVETVNVEDIPADAPGVWDIGPLSVKLFLKHCAGAQTILWNGPVGKFEVRTYAAATDALVTGLGKLEAYKVVGGGDTVVAVDRLHARSKFNHVSTGGGAMLAYLEGQPMPGLDPLYR